ncbi:MAG: delta-60 repeat domain-containing protein [Verrucomicrobiota bacterium]
MKKWHIVLVCFLATHLAAQESLDTSFDPGTGANAFIESTVVQPNGKILVCGLFTSINGTPRKYIARLNSNGSVDPTFTANPNYWVRFMALQPDKKIIIGGFFTGVDAGVRNRVARLNEDGSLDTTFNPGTGCTGRIVEADPTDPFLFAIALQSDGKIIIGGNFTNFNGIARSGVARLNSDGSLDNTFNVGTGVNSWVRSILILPNDQILLSGWFENYNNRSHNRMVRLNPDGSDDTAFNPWFGYSTSVYSMSRQSDGKIVVGGHSVNTNAPFVQEVVRLLSDGSYDPTFNTGGAGANDKVESVIIQPDGKILIGGYFSFYNNVRLRGFARLNSDGSLDPTLNAGADNWIWTLALQNDGKILMCGAFSTINGVSRNGIARLNSSDDSVPPPPPPPPPPPGPTNSFTPITGIYSGIFSSSNGVTPATAGFLTINLNGSSAFSGMILLDGVRSSFSGQFNLDGLAQKTISRRTKPTLGLNLQLDFAGGLSGAVTQNGESSILVAERGQSTLNSTKTKYTLLIPPSADPATAPGGYGFGTAQVDLKGKVNFRGVLGDGTIIRQSATVSSNGNWPLYVSLYHGRGVLLGWLTFTNEPDSDLRGENVAWTKLPGATPKFYANGFSLVGTVVGSLYVPPSSGSPPVDWTSGSVAFAGGNLAGSLSNAVALGANNKFVITSTNKTVVNLVNSSGLLNGSFIHPNTGKRTAFKGALLQKQQLGSGVFLGTNESGYFILQAMP